MGLPNLPISLIGIETEDDQHRVFIHTVIREPFGDLLKRRVTPLQAAQGQKVTANPAVAVEKVPEPARLEGTDGDEGTRASAPAKRLRSATEAWPDV